MVVERIRSFRTARTAKRVDAGAGLDPLRGRAPEAG